MDNQQKLVCVEILIDVEYGEDHQYEKGDRIWTTKGDAAECIKNGFVAAVD